MCRDDLSYRLTNIFPFLSEIRRDINVTYKCSRRYYFGGGNPVK